MERLQRRQRFGDVPRRYAVAGEVVELSSLLDEIQQVGVGAGKSRGAQRCHHRNMVGRIVDRRKTVEQVAHLLRLVDHGRALEPVGDSCFFKRDFKRIEPCAARHQNTDIIVFGRAELRIAVLRTHLPALLDRHSDRVRYHFGFLLAHLRHIPLDLAAHAANGGRHRPETAPA